MALLALTHTDVASINPRDMASIMEARGMAVPKSVVTEAELELLKVLWLHEPLTSRELAQQLAGHVYDERTMEWDAELERKIAEITAEEILTAFRKHIDPDKMSVVRAGDFEDVEEEEAGEKDSAEKQ